MFLGPCLADDPLRRPMPPRGHDLGRPTPRHGVVPGERRPLGEDLAGQPREEVLLDLADDPFDLALGLGPVRSTGPRPGAEQRGGVDPGGGIDGAAVGPAARHQGRIPVGQELGARAAQVVDAADDRAQGRGPRLVGREADPEHARIAEDGHEPVQGGAAVAERPDSAVGPVALGLDPGSGLEPDLGLGALARSELDHPPAQAGVRAGIAVSLPELAVEDRRAQVGAGGQPPFDVSEAGRGELGRPDPRVIGQRLRGGGIAASRPPVESELAGEGGDRPAMSVEHVQFHPGVLRLQSVPPVVGSKLSSPSLTGGTLWLSTQRKSPRVTPRASVRFVLISLDYSCPLTPGR